MSCSAAAVGEETGFRLAAVAVQPVFLTLGLRVMGADVDPVHPGALGGKLLDHPLVDLGQQRRGEIAPGQPRLVGDHQDRNPPFVQLPDRRPPRPAADESGSGG